MKSGSSAKSGFLSSLVSTFALAGEVVLVVAGPGLSNSSSMSILTVSSHYHARHSQSFSLCQTASLRLTLCTLGTRDLLDIKGILETFGNLLSLFH